MLKARKGVTLVELLIGLTLSALLLTGALYLFSNFLTKGFSQEKLAASNAEINNVFSQIKWDLLMAGFSLPTLYRPIILHNNTGFRSSDSLTLQSTLFRGEMGSGRWSYIIDPVSASNLVTVRRWDDPKVDLQRNDFIIFLTPLKQQIGGLYKITDRDSGWTPDSVPTYDLTLDQALSASKVFLFNVGDSNIVEEVTYSVVDGELKRSGVSLLKNVENFQTTVWLDLNQNSEIDFGEWYTDLSILFGNPSLSRYVRLVKVELLVSSKGEEGYEYKHHSMTIGDNIVTFSDEDMSRRRRAWETQSLPRNLEY